MAGRKSLSEELIKAINMPKESDTVSVEEFMQSDVARDYLVDTSNIMWGGEVNNNCIFNIYSEYSRTKDSVRLRMEMLAFVSENTTRYIRYCFPLPTMYSSDPASRVASITYFGNSADTMCLYALSDMPVY